MKLMDKAFNFANSVKTKAVAVGAAGVGIFTGTSSAQVALPPELAPITEVVDVDSVVTEVSQFGGTMLLAWAGLFLAFGLTYKLVRRLRGTA